MDSIANLVDDGSCLESCRSGIQDVDVHLDKERGQFPKKTFVHKGINRHLDCRSWVRTQELSLGLHHIGIRWRDLKHLELNEVGAESWPAHNNGGVLCTDMHDKYI